MNAALESLCAWLVDFGCLATALLAMAIALRWTIRDPARRVTLAWATWLAILAGGVLVALPQWPRIEVANLVHIPTAAERPIVAESAAQTNYVYLSAQPLEVASLPAAGPALVPPAPALAPAAIGACLWLMIAALAIGWLAIGLARAWRLIARSQPAPAWIGEELRQVVGTRHRRLPGLLTYDKLATAIALGIVRPRIVLPLASAAPSNAPAIRAALAHEWAHISSGDLWLLSLERSLMPLVALHPLFWWLRRLTRLDQELAADTVAAGDRPAEYAEALLLWAKGEPRGYGGVAALAMWERPSNLSRRIHMILDPSRMPRTGRSHLSACGLLALVFTLALGLSIVSWRPMTAEDKPVPESANSPASGEIRVYPLIGPARLTRALPAPPAAEPAIMIELQLLSLDPQALSDANVNFQELLKGVVNRPERRDPSEFFGTVAELNAKDAKHLLEVVLDAKGAQVLSHPKLVTLNGQEAVIVVGGQVPIVAVDEVVDGKHRERRVEYQEFGTKFRVKPQLLAEDPRMVVLEIAGEQTALNEERLKAADPTETPLLKSQKLKLRATVQLGKSLVLVAAAPELREDKAGGENKAPAEKRLLIVLRPSVVEHKYVEVDPVPNPAVRAAARRTVSAAAHITDEARLAEQLRNIRQALEELAREREATRQENAALRAELEQLKRSQRPAAAQEFRGDAQYFREVLQPGPRVTQVYEFASAGEAKEASDLAGAKVSMNTDGASIVVTKTTVTITGNEATIKELGPILAAKGKLIGESVNGPGPAQPPPATAGTSAFGLPTPNAPTAAKVTRVYVFPGNKEAADAVRSLAAGWKAEGQEITIDLKGNSLIVSGAETVLAKAEPVLQAIAAGNLAMQTRNAATEAVIVADPNSPPAAVQRGIEWLRAHQADGPWSIESAAKAQSAGERRTQRRLLELDLQAAELELQAAVEDFEAAERLNQRNAISAEELRNRRRLVEKTKIQVAKLRVMLEAEGEEPAAKPNPAPSK